MKTPVNLLFLFALLFLVPGCIDEDHEIELELIESFILDIPEPSGLALSVDKKSLWTVSDQNGTVYQIDLRGNILNQFAINARDLEGVAVISSTLLSVVDEKSGEIIVVTTGGVEIDRKYLGYPGDSKTLAKVTTEGLLLAKYTVDIQQIEGIAVDSESKIIYLVSDYEEKLFVYRMKRG